MADPSNFLPAIVIVFVQIIFAGVTLFSKLAMKDGMNINIMIAYRNIFAAIFLAPVGFFVERNNRPNLTRIILFEIFLCGLFGTTLNQNLYFASLSKTSMTFAAAMLNLIPAVTYVVTVTMRMERLDISTLAGKAKLLGTIIGVGGAMLLTFYKGAEIRLWPPIVDLTRTVGSGAPMPASTLESTNLILGSLLALGSCFCFTLWLIIQAKSMDAYPCPLSCTTLIYIMGAIQSFLYAICIDRNWNDWKLEWDIRLWSIAYTGIIGSALGSVMLMWVIKQKGPLYAAMSNPLMLIGVAIMGSLLLNEKLHFGSIVGAALIVVGVYAVLWGKGKDITSKSTDEEEDRGVVDHA